MTNMYFSRRRFLATAAATAGGVAFLPCFASAAAGSADAFETSAGRVTVHPVDHASFVMETPVGKIYSDPVGGASAYAGLPAPDLILVTHQHSDHYDAATLEGLVRADTRMIVNPAVYAMLPDALKAKARSIGNGERTSFDRLQIDAIPAYNTTEGRLQFHPEGRDNGYVLTLDGFRVYISGDTEDTPEMRALEDIDLAFVCMNLPFTMSADAAASAVSEVKPKVVYPYHYRGRDGGTQDPAEFAARVGDAATVNLADWYGS